MNRSAKKEHLRSSLLEMRREMAFEEVYLLSSRIQKRFMDTTFFKSAGSFSIYSSFQNEVLTDDIFQKAIEQGKEVAFPRVIRRHKQLAFFKVSQLTELTPGSYEILEPEEKEVRADPESFDLVVVPGTAFDLRGARLGYGKGFYDMALSTLKCPIIALAYDFQVLNETIPIEPHDIKVNAIITEKRVIRL